MATEGPLMEGHATDRAGAPIIERVSAKIATLERRADHLEKRLQDYRGSRASEDFDRAEAAALRAGIAALRYHRAELEGLDTPVLALQELVEAVSGQPMVMEEPLSAALQRSRQLLEDWA